MTEPEFLTLSEVAAMFRVGKRTVWQWRRDGKITGVITPGGRYIFRRTDVEQLLQAASHD